MTGSPSFPYPYGGPSACCTGRREASARARRSLSRFRPGPQGRHPYNVSSSARSRPSSTSGPSRRSPRANHGSPPAVLHLYLYPAALPGPQGHPLPSRMRGSIDGIQPIDAIKVFSLRDRLRRGVFLHTSLHARLDPRANKSGPGSAEENKTNRQVKPGADQGPA